MMAKDLQRRTESAPTAARASRAGVTWLAVLVAFAAGAGAGWTGARVFAGDPAAGASRVATTAREAVVSAGELRERMLALDPFVVNLSDDEDTRYLKVRVELEAESPASRSEIEARLAQVRDGVISVLSARDVADATSLEGKTLLKHDIQDRVNALLQGGRVRSVLFTEFVVQ